jgi:hypothetical protein
MADVSEALPAALAALGLEITVFIAVSQRRRAVARLAPDAEDTTGPTCGSAASATRCAIGR